jgi:hypothetical protein
MMSVPVTPTDFNRPKQDILSDVDVDGLGHAVLTLCHELWILRDRMAILETVLSKHGIDASEEIERLEPDEALQERLRTEGRALVERVIGALNGD